MQEISHFNTPLNYLVIFLNTNSGNSLFGNKTTFIVILTLVIASIMYIIYKLSIRAVVRHERKLEILVNNKTAELRQKNMEITKQSMEISQRNEEILFQKEHLARQNKIIEKQNEELEQHKLRLEELVTKRTADLEKAKAKAEESDLLKRAFLTNMSHEIRTPLNAILGFTELISDPDITGGQKSEFMRLIKHNGEMLLQLVDDLIDVSRIETGQLSINKAECRPKTILIELFNHYNDLLIEGENPNLELFVDIPTEIAECTVHTDAFRLRQILVNLIDNALKYTEKGFVKFGFSLDETWLHFYVTDTGIGMPEDKLDFIFDRFTKLDEDSLRLYRGTGIGLAISKSLVQLLGGRISVETKLGIGSTFRFTIPNIKEKYALPIDLYKKVKWDDKVFIIAEDEMANYVLMRQILAPSKAQIRWAKNGLEAVEFVKVGEKIDLVLMDIKMPLLDGYEATRQIKQINKDIPIIAITAYAISDEANKVKLAGCNDLLLKPIEANSLVALIKRHLFEL